MERKKSRIEPIGLSLTEQAAESLFAAEISTASKLWGDFMISVTQIALGLIG